MNTRQFFHGAINLWGASEKRIFLVIFLMVSIFRAFTIATIFNGDPFAHSGDAAQYHYFALSIAQNPGWVGMHLGVVPPLYPFFIAAVYTVAGECPLCALYAQCLLAGLTAGLIFLMGKRLFGTPVGVLSALFLMVHPSAMTWGGMLIRETLILLTFALTLFATLEIRQGLTNRRVILLGAAYSLLIHTDPRFLFYAPFLALYLFIPRRPGKWGWKPAFLLTFVTILLMVPWTVRNFIAYDEFVLIDTRTLGFIQMKGVEDISYLKPPPEIAEISRLHGALPAVDPPGPASEETTVKTPVTEMDSRPERGHALDKARENFLEFWRVCRFRDGHSPKFMPKWSRSHNYGSVLYFAPLLLLTAVGGFLSWRLDRTTTVILLFPLLGHTLLHVVTPFANTRYRLPIELPMILISMYALVWILFRIFRKDYRTDQAGTVSGGNP